MKSLPSTQFLAFLAVISLSITSAHAITIASWDTFGADGDETTLGGSAAGNVIAENMIRGPDLGKIGGDNSFNSNGWSNTDAGDYIEFGFAVEAGYSVALQTLHIGTRSSGTGPGTIGVYTSLDGFAAPVMSLVQPVQPNDGYVDHLVDLSGLDSVSGSFYVRLIEIGNTQADGSGDTATGGTFRITNLSDDTHTRFMGTVLSATESVPDGGATFVLLSLGLFSLLGARRKLA